MTWWRFPSRGRVDIGGWFMPAANAVEQQRASGLRAAAMDEADKHIAEALELLDDALGRRPGPKPSVRSIRAYLVLRRRREIRTGSHRRSVLRLRRFVSFLR